MRYSAILTAFSFLLAASCIVMPDEAQASEHSDFVNWALDQGKTCDQSWIRITDGKAAAVSSSRKPHTRPAARSGRSVSGRAVRSNGASRPLSTKFTQRGTPPFLQMSTRVRSSPTRGVTKMTNPASISRGAPYNRKRPFSSSVQIRSSIRRRTDFSRPRLKSFGRISSGGRRRGVSRPSSGRYRRGRR